MVRKSSSQQRMLDREAQEAKVVASEEESPQEAAQEPQEGTGTLVPPEIADGLEKMLAEHESGLTPRQQMIHNREKPETD